MRLNLKRLQKATKKQTPKLKGAKLTNTSNLSPHDDLMYVYSTFKYSKTLPLSADPATTPVGNLYTRSHGTCPP